jgi:hypothetical protein
MNSPFKHNDKHYVIHRQIPISYFTNKQGHIDIELVKDWRDYLPKVNHVLRNETHYLFAETIEDAEEILEESHN